MQSDCMRSNYRWVQSVAVRGYTPKKEGRGASSIDHCLVHGASYRWMHQASNTHVIVMVACSAFIYLTLVTHFSLSTTTCKHYSYINAIIAAVVNALNLKNIWSIDWH